MSGYLYGAMFEIEERLRMAARLGLDYRLAPADCRAILRELARLNLGYRMSPADCWLILREMRRVNQENRALAKKVQEANAPTN